MIEMIKHNSFHESKKNFCSSEKVLIEKIWTVEKMDFSGKYIEKMFKVILH